MTLILVVSVVLTVLSSNSGHSKLRQLMEDFQETEGKIIGRVSDIFRGNRDVKMYAIEEKHERQAFFESADVLRKKGVRPRREDPPRQHAPGSGGHRVLRAGAARGGGPLHERPPHVGDVLLVSRCVRRAPGAGAADVPATGGPRPRAGEPQPAQRRADDGFLHARAEDVPLPVPEKADLDPQGHGVPLSRPTSRCCAAST